MVGTIARRFLLIALLILAGGPARSHDDAMTITWALNDFPPFIMVDGPLPGAGFVDAAVRYVVERTPEYHHRFEIAGAARALGLMRQGQPVCHPALLPTDERRSFAYFSRPVHFALTHRVVVRQAAMDRMRPYINAQGEVDVPRLLADRTLSTSITDQRAFTPVIDAALAAVRGAPNVQSTGVHFDAPFLQLAAGWIDYLFAYPVEIGWYRATGRIPADLSLSYLKVAGSPEFTIGHITCTKNPWGEKVIARLDAVLAQAGPRPPWLDVELRYSDPESARLLEEGLTRVQPFAP